MKNKSNGPLVYSTNPDAMKTTNSDSEIPDVLPKDQQLWVLLESKHRGGKTVTIIYGFEGANSQIEELGKRVKTFCGTGGSVKDGEILVQGNHVQKIVLWLKQQGFSKTKMR